MWAELRWPVKRIKYSSSCKMESCYTRRPEGGKTGSSPRTEGAWEHREGAYQALGPLIEGHSPSAASLETKGTNLPTSLFSQLEAKVKRACWFSSKRWTSQGIEQSEEGWEWIQRGPWKISSTFALSKINPVLSLPSFSFKSVISGKIEVTFLKTII